MPLEPRFLHRQFAPQMGQDIISSASDSIRGRHVCQALYLLLYESATYGNVEQMTTLSQHLSNLGKKGGKARAKKLTKQQLSEAGKKAIRARWAKQKKEK